LIWGCHWSVAKIGLETIPPFSYAMLRLLVAMAVLAVLMQGAGRLRRPAPADIPIVISYGLLAIAVGIGIMNLALPWVEAGRASIAL
jgi:drug/metabolite transporter (DMT)-like permease